MTGLFIPLTFFSFFPTKWLGQDEGNNNIARYTKPHAFEEEKSINDGQDGMIGVSRLNLEEALEGEEIIQKELKTLKKQFQSYFENIDQNGIFCFNLEENEEFYDMIGVINNDSEPL